MKAATYTQGRGFEIADRPEPRIGPDEMLIRVRATALCATDVKIVRHGHRKLAPGQRIVLGHEFAGEVAALGANVTGYRVGDRVGVAPNAGCGVCDACTRGLSNYCPAFTAFGIDRDGSHAPCVSIPAAHLRQGNVVPLPDGVAWRDAALLEPLSCAVAGLAACRVEAGDTVAVFGAGPMGRLLIALAAQAGAGHVLAIDPAMDRLEKAVAAGATATAAPGDDGGAGFVMGRTAGKGCDVAVVACPVAEAQRDALRLLAPFGRLCLFAGLAVGTTPLALDTNAIHYRRLSVTGTTGGSVEDYRRALSLVSAGRIRLDGILAAELPLDDLEQAYRMALGGVDGKVALLA